MLGAVKATRRTVNGPKSIAFRSGDRCPLPLLGPARRQPGPAPRAQAVTGPYESGAAQALEQWFRARSSTVIVT